MPYALIIADFSLFFLLSLSLSLPLSLSLSRLHRLVRTYSKITQVDQVVGNFLKPTEIYAESVKHLQNASSPPGPIIP